MTEPAGARLPDSVALALPLSPAATAHFTVWVPACTAVTRHTKRRVWPGARRPSAQVLV